MKAVILAGGLGTRISEETIVRPKPMIEIGGKPVLWHILKLYSHHGYIQVVNIDRLDGVGELGICLAPAAQGSGLASEACQLLEPYLRRIIGLRKLVLKVLATNSRAVAFYRKSGYREVGRLESHFRIDDRFEDVLIMERFLSR